jgi:hypothetical protein
MEKEYTRQLEKIEAVLNTWLPESPDSAWLEKGNATKQPGTGFQILFDMKDLEEVDLLG